MSFRNCYSFVEVTRQFPKLANAHVTQKYEGMKFKAEHTFEQRLAESDRVRAKYPDRIPGNLFPFIRSKVLAERKFLVICEKIDKSKMEVRVLCSTS